MNMTYKGWICPRPGPGQGAGAGTPWARGLGAPGPKMWDTRGERNYLLSGRLPTVRQATYCQAKLPTVRQATYSQAKLPTVRQSYLQSGKATYSQACTQQPHTCTQPSHRHAPKRHRHAPKSIHRLAPNFRILCIQWGGVHFQNVQYLIVFEIEVRATFRL